MGWLSFFKGKTPDEIENKADELIQKGIFGPAKIEYENALDRHQKKPSEDADFESRIHTKIKEAQETLAGEHLQNSRELIASGCSEDASELLRLAVELTEKEDVKAEIEALMKQIAEGELEALSAQLREGPGETAVAENGWGSGRDDEESLDEEQYLTALLEALPPEEKEAYPGYGESFLKGFSALNRGEFEAAATLLSESMEENSDGSALIPLELATCYLNMEKYGEAKTLLESFQTEHPDADRVYPLLCETLWALEEYDQAMHLLDHCPDNLEDQLTIVILKGETLVQVGKNEEAKRYYLDYIDENGRNEPVDLALAQIYKNMGETEEAMTLYGDLVKACTSCGRQAAPELRRWYADACFDSGNHTITVLELYLGLAKEDPANSSEYYGKVSGIYSSLGNDVEAQRFHKFSIDSQNQLIKHQDSVFKRTNIY